MHETPGDQLRELARKMLTGTITPEEQKILEQWLNSHPGDELVWDGGDSSEEQLGNRIFAGVVKKAKVRKPKRFYWKAAAAVIILLSVATFLWYPQETPPARQVVEAVKPAEDIMPGSDKAILTLGNGKQIQLEGQKVITDGDLQIRNENNELIYEGSSAVSFNTMTTPRGGQYQLRLPDGSRVWLNASSSLTYPTAFTGNDRVVEIDGEAYFEVAKNPAKPFKVKLKRSEPKSDNHYEITVLGTHFNVMAYDDETMLKTTLVEGSVHIAKGTASALLKPGEEANVNNSSEKIKVTPADVEQATAWKNGMFLFNRTDIKSIMRQLSRWYDFEVKYDKSFENRNFSGMISRNTALSQVLKMLQMTKDVKFKIEGRTVTVI